MVGQSVLYCELSAGRFRYSVTSGRGSMPPWEEPVDVDSRLCVLLATSKFGTL